MVIFGKFYRISAALDFQLRKCKKACGNPQAFCIACYAGNLTPQSFQYFSTLPSL